MNTSLSIVNNLRFNKAIYYIKQFLLDEIQTVDLVYKYYNTTTNNYKEFRKDFLENGIHRITLEGLSGSMYTSEYFHTLARVWHDQVHLKHHRDFSHREEIEVWKGQQSELDNYLIRKHSNAMGNNCIEDIRLLLYLDVVGQATEYLRTGEFIKDQKEYILTCFNRVITNKTY